MKYMGSKSRIAKYILPFIQRELQSANAFVDVFCGGCNIIDKIDHPLRIANDKNKYLIAMWKDLQQGKSFPTEINRELYTRVRESFRKNDGQFSDAFIGWIGFMASFNGRFFDGGYSGHAVSVKNGKQRDYITESISHILKQLGDIKDVVFMSEDYKDLYIPTNSVLYCDPPYNKTKGYCYNIDYDVFWEWCREQSLKGHKVFISEYEAPEDFKCLWEQKVTNAMNLNLTKTPIEKLFTC